VWSEQCVAHPFRREEGQQEHEREREQRGHDSRAGPAGDGVDQLDQWAVAETRAAPLPDGRVSPGFSGK
jgi:hypothetical protein